jgi:hypothetical protein
MPFTTMKSNAKVGHYLFECVVRAVELTRTMLAAPQKTISMGLNLGQ